MTCLKTKFEVNKTAQGNVFLFLLLYSSFLFIFILIFFFSLGTGRGWTNHCVPLVNYYKNRSSRRRCSVKERAITFLRNCLNCLAELYFLPFQYHPFHLLNLFLCGISFLLPVNWNWNLYVRLFGLILEITVNYIK